ncbi:MAG: protein kinase, partial [Myxococcales bacterium]|nr:protein kinase [Myxococcales bacterium]
MTEDLEPGAGLDAPLSQTDPTRPSVIALRDTLEASSARGTADTDGRHESGAPAEPELSTLGRFRVLGKLGQGGMGLVYLGLDERLGRKVAIKLIRSRGSEADQSRLLREAQAMAQLSHPNVAQIYEIGDEHGIPFIVMELIEGETLDRWLTRERPGRRELLKVFAAAGKGLAAAHQKGLVHR